MSTLGEMYQTAPTRLPPWVRWILGAGAAAILSLGGWLMALAVRQGDWLLGLGATLVLTLAVSVLIGVARGRLWRWLWFFPFPHS